MGFRIPACTCHAACRSKMNFDEDKCRMRRDNSKENLSVICYIVLSLNKSYTNAKLSMKAKRFRCSFDDEFLCAVILNKFC